MCELFNRIEQISALKERTLKDFLNNCGIRKSTWDMGKSRGSKPSIDTIMSVLNAYPDISAEWLMRGTGNMLCGSQDGDIEIDENAINKIYKPKYAEKTIENEVINLYDIDAAANLKTLLAAKGEYIMGKIAIPNAPKCDGALYVRGDSMYPLLKSGDIVAYKEIKPDLRNIFWGEMYVVDMDVDGDDYLVVKYVQRSDKGEDWIKLVSYNQYHQPKDFPVSCVRAMALVKLSIRMNTIK